MTKNQDDYLVVGAHEGRLTFGQLKAFIDRAQRLGVNDDALIRVHTGFSIHPEGSLIRQIRVQLTRQSEYDGA